MKDMKIKTKMIIGFAIPIILTIINVVVGMSSVRRITASTENMQEEVYTTVQQTLQQIGADETKANTLLNTMQSVIADDMELIENTATISNYVSFAMIIFFPL